MGTSTLSQTRDGRWSAHPGCWPWEDDLRSRATYQTAPDQPDGAAGGQGSGPGAARKLNALFTGNLIGALKTEVYRLNVNNGSKLDDTARLRASRYVSSPFLGELGAVRDLRHGRRRVERRWHGGVEPASAATRMRRGAGLELIPVTGGGRHGAVSAAVDSAIGTELSRRSR